MNGIQLLLAAGAAMTAQCASAFHVEDDFSVADPRGGAYGIDKDTALSFRFVLP